MVVGPLFSLKTILVAFVMYLVLLSLQCLCSTVCVVVGYLFSLKAILVGFVMY